jgi:hypothetical protein
MSKKPPPIELLPVPDAGAASAMLEEIRAQIQRSFYRGVIPLPSQKPEPPHG